MTHGLTKQWSTYIIKMDKKEFILWLSLLPRSNFKSKLSLLVRVNVVLNRTVVVDSDWRFDNLCGSHLQSQSEFRVTLTLKMTTAQVVATSVTINNNSPIQDYVNPDDQSQPTFQLLLCFLVRSDYNINHYPWEKDSGFQVSV